MTPHIPIVDNWSDVQNRKWVGGTPHIPIEYILSNLYIRVGTLQKILRYLRSRGGTPHIPIDGISELGWDTAQDYKMFLKQGGDTAHSN